MAEATARKRREPMSESDVISAARPPTLREQVEVFHLVMNAFNVAQTGGRSDHVRMIVEAMDNWSYAHRVGNGEMTDKEQQRCVNCAFWMLNSVVRNVREKETRTEDGVNDRHG